MAKASKALQDRKATKIRIEHWEIDSLPPVSRASRAVGFRAMASAENKAVLTGKIYNHPDYEEGEDIKIYDIVNYDYKLRVVRTPAYEIQLGTPTVEYAQWLKQNGYIY